MMNLYKSTTARSPLTPATPTAFHPKAHHPSAAHQRLNACQAMDPIQAAATAQAIRSFAICGLSMYGINQSSEYLGKKTGNEFIRNVPPAVAALIVGSAIRSEVTNLQAAFEPIPEEDRPEQTHTKTKDVRFEPMRNFPGL